MQMRKILLPAVLVCFFTSCHNASKHNPVSVTTASAPKPIGSCSQATKAGKDIYCSGQIGIDPSTGNLAGPDVNTQATQAIKNLKMVVEAAGSDMEHVMKVNIYFKNLSDLNLVNDIYKDYFPGLKPARTVTEVTRLPNDALVEFDCVAVSKE